MIAWSAYERGRLSNIVQRLPYIPPGAPPYPSVPRPRHQASAAAPRTQGPATPSRVNTRPAGQVPVTAATPTRTHRSSDRTLGSAAHSRISVLPIADSHGRAPATSSRSPATSATVTPQRSTRSQRSRYPSPVSTRMSAEPTSPHASTSISSPSSLEFSLSDDENAIEACPFWETASQAFVVFQGNDHGIFATW